MLPCALYAQASSINLNWYELEAPRGYLVQIFEVDGSTKTRIKAIKTSRQTYQLSTSFRGILYYTVVPINDKNKPDNSKRITKYIFVDGPLPDVQIEDIYQCSALHKFKWNPIYGKPKYLFRVYDFDNKREVYTKILRSEEILVPKRYLKIEGNYKITIFGRNDANLLSKHHEQFVTIRDCTRKARLMDRNESSFSSVYYLPSMTASEQTGFTTISATQSSYLNLGYKLWFNQRSKNKFSMAFEANIHEKDGDFTGGETLHADFTYKRPTSSKTDLFASIQYDDFYSYNDRAYHNYGSVIEDRSHMLTLVGGIEQSVYSWGYKSTFKAGIGTTIYSAYQLGDSDLSGGSSLSGQVIVLENETRLNKKLSFLFRYRYQSFSGDYDLTKSTLALGPTYSF